MHTLRLHHPKALHAWRPFAFALLLVVAVLGTSVVTHGYAAWSHAMAPAYVSHTSSLIGTADGTLLEGEAAGATTQPGTGFGLWLVLGSLLGLSVVVVSLSTVYSRLARRYSGGPPAP